jgi:hypothetical protein
VPHSDCRIVAPGVTRINCIWGYWLEGTKEALLRSGLALPGWFVEASSPATPAQVTHTVKAIHNGNPVLCIQPGKGLCHVRIVTGKDETAKRSRYDGYRPAHWRDCLWRPNPAALKAAELAYRVALRRSARRSRPG